MGLIRCLDLNRKELLTNKEYLCAIKINLLYVLFVKDVVLSNIVQEFFYGIHRVLFVKGWVNFQEMEMSVRYATELNLYFKSVRIVREWEVLQMTNIFVQVATEPDSDIFHQVLSPVQYVMAPVDVLCRFFS